MSYVKQIGKWEVEKSITENKVFISDKSGNLLAEFDMSDSFGLAEWIHNNKH